MTLRIGIDTGGTFTDLVVADGDYVQVVAKSLTTHDDLANGLLTGLGKAGVSGESVEQIVHGTTVALNAILTRRGAEVGMVTTKGFGDLMDMGRGWRSEAAIADPRWRRPHELRPIVDRYRRRNVSERMLPDGTALVALDEDELLAEVGELHEEGCRSVAVCFLHAYKHPAHERRAAELIRKRFPDLSVSTSSGVAPFPREYNRFSTCVLNAYSQPLMDSYTRSVKDRLAGDGFTAPLQFMTNDGGLSSPESVSEKPVTTLNSGPVGGVMGVQSYSRMLGMPNLVGFDMGGTSTDVAVIANGVASNKRELELEHDLIVSMPVLEIHSIGAGGGSVASVDPVGGLSVGPESAGSKPGPACYGQGGTVPTVTDALLLLGWLDPETSLGGEIKPDVAAAERAYATIGESISTAPLELAGTVAQVAIHNMAEAIRRLTVYRGVDPRKFGLLAYGAAGPFAATQVARVLEMPSVVFPALAGVFSAYGMLEGADFEEEVLPVMTVADDRLVTDLFAGMRKSGIELIELLTGGDTGAAHLEFYVDAMYAGQRWELPAVIDPTTDEPLAHLSEAFRQAHERQFGYSLPAPIHISTVRTRAVKRGERGVRPGLLENRDPTPPKSRRDVVLGGRTHADTPVYGAGRLASGQTIEGPAVIEAESYTGVLVPGDTAEVNEYGDVIIELKEVAA